MKSCVYIPNNKKGEPSKLFTDLQKITGNRDTTKALWGISQDADLMKSLGNTVGLEEPTVLDFLNSIPDIQSILSSEAYVKYLNLKEGLDEKKFETFEQASIAKENLVQEYSSVLPIVSYSDKGYKITLQPKNSDSIQSYANQEALSNLNRKLISHLAKMGLAIEELKYLEVPGKLDPLNAKVNAENLLTAIKVAKGLEGQKAIPEEFAHVLVEGFRSHPLMARLLKAFDNVELIKDVLGDSYEQYSKVYENNLYKLKAEAVAKLIAQYLADREGISDNISGVSNRFLNVIKDVLSNGDESYIAKLIKNIDKDIKSFIESLSDEDTFNLFDLDALKNAPTMYKVSESISKLQELSEKALEIVAKKMKLENLRRKSGKVPKEDAKTFKDLKNLVDKKKYADSCISFLGTCMTSVEEIVAKLELNREKLSGSAVLSAKDIKIGCRLLKDASNILSAYTEIVQRMQSISKEAGIEEELDSDDINKIEEAAIEVSKVLGDIRILEKELRLKVLLKFYEKYWGKDKILGKGDDAKIITLEQVLESTVGDTNAVSRLVNAMSDMPDMLMQLVDIAYKDTTAKRDSNIFDLQQQLGALQKKLIESTGSRDTSFMFEKDENGNPTGMIISDRDFRSYYKARREYRKSLEDVGLDKETIAGKMKAWEVRNTEPVKISDRKTERLPKKSLYPSNALDKLSVAQKEYYDVAMKIKIAMDDMLPNNRTHTYWAVQKKVRGVDAVMQDKSLKKAYERFKSKFVVDKDDTEFGELDLDEGKYMVTDFGGNPVKKIPVFYTSWLGEDMQYLDTNFTDSLLAYGSMAYNYESMTEIVDAMELTNLQMQDRKVYQTEGKKKLRTRFKWMDTAFGSDYYKEGSSSELQKKLLNYLEANVYGKRKIEEITPSGFNYGKAGDVVKSYASMVSMGYNLFSGTANASMGLTQSILNAIGGEHFGVKDLLWAHKEYFKKVPGNIADGYSDIQDNKLSLLSRLFDTEEDFFSTTKESGFNKGVLKKMIGKHNPLILNSMGEHYLHSIGMLSILNNIKCRKVGSKEVVSLYDVFKEEEIKDASGNVLYKQLSIPEGYKIVEDDVEVADLNNAYLQKLKLKIQNVNHTMHGAFGEVDRGDAHRSVIGRLILQYRQWMPAYYMNRFKSKRYNLTTDQEEEGFYLTGAKFIWGTLKDLKDLKFQIATKYKSLSNHEKSNLWKALSEVSLYYVIGLILSNWAGDDDDEDAGILTLLKYNLYRVRMELGASAPTSTDFFKNVTTLLNSPVPCLQLTDRLINLIDVTNLFDEIESGKYKGWNKWTRDLFYSIPYARNIDKVIDIANGDTSILNPYRK